MVSEEQVERLQRLKEVGERMYTLCHNGTLDKDVPERFRESMKRLAAMWAEVYWGHD